MTKDDVLYGENVLRVRASVSSVYISARHETTFYRNSYTAINMFFFSPCNEVLRCIGIFSFLKVSTNDDTNGRCDVKLYESRLLSVNQAFTLRFTVTDRALEIVCLQPFQYFLSLIRALVMQCRLRNL